MMQRVFFSLHVFSWLRFASLLCLQHIGWLRLSKCQCQSRWKTFRFVDFHRRIFLFFYFFPPQQKRSTKTHFHLFRIGLELRLGERSEARKSDQSKASRGGSLWICASETRCWWPHHRTTPLEKKGQGSTWGAHVLTRVRSLRPRPPANHSISGEVNVR